MRLIRAFLLLFFVVGSAAACATSGGTAVRSDPTEISSAEIAEMEGRVTNLYDLVQRLRPRWLSIRGDRSFGSGTEVVVYQDQTLLGGTETLRNIDLGYAVSLEYLDASQAVAQLAGLGSRRIEGAIVINTR